LIARLARAGLLTGVSDGLFASVLAAFFFQSTVMRLWQGVASTLLGPAAFDGGARTAAVGLLMHFGVAFAWSAVFLVLFSAAPFIREAVASPSGVIAVAAVYGPLIWLAMSLGTVPLLTHRPPVINIRWWVQLAGHFPFVALPMVASIARR
jgi:uncharacterized membrane protein YagU involved in acid resistance